MEGVCRDWLITTKTSLVRLLVSVRVLLSLDPAMAGEGFTRLMQCEGQALQQEGILALCSHSKGCQNCLGLEGAVLNCSALLKLKDAVLCFWPMMSVLFWGGKNDKNAPQL